jgi:hypothetical protein
MSLENAMAAWDADFTSVEAAPSRMECCPSSRRVRSRDRPTRFVAAARAVRAELG